MSYIATDAKIPDYDCLAPLFSTLTTGLMSSYTGEACKTTNTDIAAHGS